MLMFIELPEWAPYAAAVAAIVGLVWAITSWLERRRTQALAALSLEMGFLFVGTDWNGVAQPPQCQTALFNRGHHKRFQNIMSSHVAGLRTFLFDYIYVVGGGRSSRTYRQTVAAFCKDGAHLPQFEFRPKGLMQKLWDAMVHKDITFDSNPNFANRFVLRSPEVERTCASFTPGLLSFLESLDPAKKWQIEGLGDTLIVYRSGKRAKPPVFKSFLQETSALAQQFFSLGHCK
jgi:hypothetical protein